MSKRSWNYTILITLSFFSFILNWIWEISFFLVRFFSNLQRLVFIVCWVIIVLIFMLQDSLIFIVSLIHLHTFLIRFSFFYFFPSFHFLVYIILDDWILFNLYVYWIFFSSIFLGQIRFNPYHLFKVFLFLLEAFYFVILKFWFLPISSEYWF